MRLKYESELFLEPRFTVSIRRAGGPQAGDALSSGPNGAKMWRVRCRGPEGGSDPQALQDIYGRAAPGQIYLADTTNRLADAVFSRSTLGALDGTRPGKRHVSFALGASLLDMLLARKELLVSGCVTVELTELLHVDWVSHLDEFVTALIVRSARASLSRQRQRVETDRVQVGLVIPESADHAQAQDEVDAVLFRAQAMADAMLWTRSLVNAPPNMLRPDSFERVVTEVVRQRSAAPERAVKEMRMEVFRGAALAELNCSLIRAVGQGSSVEPRLIKLTLRSSGHQVGGAPQTQSRTVPRIAIVGKGITFDSGGYDIKPSSAMRNMKKDMGGAAAAFGIFLAAADLDLGVDLDVYLCLAENMISGDAFRPGDVIAARDGSMIEIENTDAEGRLVLADALHLAAETQPDWILDFATLTGAARVALGPEVDAMVSNEADKALLMTMSGVETGDWVWQLPRVTNYQKMIESAVGDVMNSSTGGQAGPLTAALFLERFVGRSPWTHIDTYMWSEKPGSLTSLDVGATAKCVRLACEALRRYSESYQARQ